MSRFFDVGQEASGVIAIGQFATGVIAIGQMATGVIAIGQLARGAIAIGMVAFGLFSVGMASVGIGWAGGMMAIGGRAVGMAGIPLAPFKPRAVSPGWIAIALVQLSLLVLASILFWRFAMVPIGDALFGPGAILRSGG